MWWTIRTRARSAVTDSSFGVTLRTGQPAPADRVRRVVAAQARLTVIGHSPSTDDELRSAAEALSAGSPSAAVGLHGSHVVLAETASGDTYVTGDLAGQRAVYYGTAPDGTIVVSSHARQVASIVGDCLDREWLAIKLLLAGAVDMWQARTPWRKVSAVPPGCLLHIDRHGTTRIRKARVEFAATTMDAAAEQLRLALDHAVGSRVRGALNPTADLSGGLDSSTICGIAARHATFRAMTVTDPDVADSGYACVTSTRLVGVGHDLLEEPAGILPYSDLNRTMDLDQPLACHAVIARERWWFQAITENRSDLHLSGDGGDGVLVAPPAYLADLASPGGMRLLLNHCRGWAKLRHLAPSALLRAAVALRGTSYPDSLRGAADNLVSRGDVQPGWDGLVSWFGVAGTLPWATPEARHLAADAARTHADHHAWPDAPGRFGTGDSVAWMALTSFGHAQRAYVDFAALHGVSHHAPFLDNEVVRACWSVPAAQRTSPYEAKPLLRNAAHGLVPDVVLDRRDKGDYTRLHYQGLRANWGTIHDLLSSSRLAELGLIDAVAVRETLHRGVAGVPIRLGAFDTVLATELWLRSLQTAPAVSEVTNNVASA
ncbi:albusnodin/ikarugamycin family macrolactam cyclase [Nocardioides speluncae]|uniref:albusnodin/ikarugamycin family macrolactam cyclase n=1 Tax=Nocardioides speluncae TaxID=2670337 RepID=UPI000D69921E|nr:albusnodin/ikarugamycin family macrolactam cyclase [Nocardioides speluncae]